MATTVEAADVTRQRLADHTNRSTGGRRSIISALSEREVGSTPLAALLRLVFWAAAASLVWALAKRSITLGDEGYILSQAANLVAGKVPYRDFDLFVTPAAWYLNAAIFKITGPSVLATRVAAALCLLATMAVSKRIVDEAAGHAISTTDSSGLVAADAGAWGYGAAALVGVFAVWAFPAWTISFYSPYAVLTAMAALVCSLTAMRTGQAKWHFASGVLLGVTIAFKQNYGVLAATGCVFGLFVDAIAGSRLPLRTSVQNFLASCAYVAAGAALVIIPGVALLAVQGALPEAVQSLVVRPFHGFLDAHSTPYLPLGDLWRRSQVWTSGGLLYMAVPMMRPAVLGGWPAFAIQAAAAMHVALYWLPWLAFTTAGVHAVVQAARHQVRNRALVSTAIFAATFFLGVFPRADFNHLINVYQPVLVLLVALAANLFGGGLSPRSGTVLRLVAAGGGFVVACYVAVAVIWFLDLTRSMTFVIESPRAGVLVDEADARTVNHEIELIHSKTREDEPVFAIPGLSMVPFLADRPMPTRYYNYQSVHIAHDSGRSAADEIERSGARVLLIHTFNFFADPVGLLTYAPELAEYLVQRFRTDLLIAGRTHQLLVRRETPLEAAHHEWLWPNCEIAGNEQTLREELLTRTLHHSFTRHGGPTSASVAIAADTNPPTNEIVTRCRLQVPPRASLRIAADLSQPLAAASADGVSAELWLLTEGKSPRLLLHEEWNLATEPALSTKAREEHEIDLRGAAGSTVTLELRSRLDGATPASPGGLERPSVTWSGGLVVTRGAQSAALNSDEADESHHPVP